MKQTKIRQHLHDYRTWLVVTVLVGLLAVWAGFFVWNSTQQLAADYLDMQLDDFRGEINAAQRSHERFSQYVFDQVVNRPQILQAVAAAWEGESGQREYWRWYLYDRLLEDYGAMQEFHFRQLHFHFPNGDSFLRFHSPHQYGDNLFAVRESVRLANEERRMVSGFEEGRIFNGYRFVYPLFYREEHVGSVEVSVSLAKVIADLHEIHPQRDAIVLLRRSVVETTVFPDAQVNYLESSLSDAYLVDREVFEMFWAADRRLEESREQRMIADLGRQVDHRLAAEESFAVHFDRNGVDHLVVFLSLRNIRQEHIGYLVTVSPDQTLPLYRQNARNGIWLHGVLYAAFAGISWFFARDKLRLRWQSSTDSLTGLWNRAGFLPLAEAELGRSQRYGNPVSLLLVDIDHFKRINDTYGHNIGDDVLREVAGVILANTRRQDLCVRWGGEEFLVFLPETDLDGAVQTAEKLREIVADTAFTHGAPVTISVGVSERLAQETELRSMVRRADLGLYEVKYTGRNGVRVGPVPLRAAQS